MRVSISPTSIKKFASSNGCRIEYFCTNDVLEKLYRKNRLVYCLYRVARAVLRIISCGQIGDSEYWIVLKKCCQNIDTQRQGRLSAVSRPKPYRRQTQDENDSFNESEE